MNARSIRRLLWLAGFACLWLPLLDNPPLRTGAYLQDVTVDAATVAMITSGPVQLVCALSDTSGVRVAERGSDVGRRHAMRFQGLSPGTEYHYAVREVGGGLLDEGRLKTAPDEDRAHVRFVFLGDSGDQPWWVWMQRSPAIHLPAARGWFAPSPAVTGIGRAVAAYAPDFVLHLGDVVYPRGLHAHYSSGFFRPFAEAMRHAPFYAVMGNHDAMDADGVQFLRNFHLPRGETTGDGRCYSFARGAVRIIALDCNLDRGAGLVEAGHPSLEFLLQELERCSEPWIVVASHFPMRSASRQRDRADLLLNVLPALRERRVSLYLSGHDHCYQRFGAGSNEVPLIVSGGGGKDLYDVRPDARAQVLQSQYHWCSAEVVGSNLLVRAHGLDGGLIDSLPLPLPSAEDLAEIRKRNPARAKRIEALAAR